MTAYPVPLSRPTAARTSCGASLEAASRPVLSAPAACWTYQAAATLSHGIGSDSENLCTCGTETPAHIRTAWRHAHCRMGTRTKPSDRHNGSRTTLSRSRVSRPRRLAVCHREPEAIAPFVIAAALGIATMAAALFSQLPAPGQPAKTATPSIAPTGLGSAEPAMAEDSLAA